MEDNKILEFLKKHSSTLILALCACVAIGFYLDRKLSSKSSVSTKDFVLLRQASTRLHSGEFLSAETKGEVAKILKRHPELHPSYDCMMAVALLGQDDTTTGLGYASTIQQRLAKVSPQYAEDFTNTTFLIEQQKYVEAVKACLALETELKTAVGYDTLRAFNLWRLVSLGTILKDENLQSKAIAALKASPAYVSLKTLFQEKEFSLDTYFSNL